MYEYCVSFFYVSGFVETLAMDSITNFPIKDNKLYFIFVSPVFSQKQKHWHTQQVQGALLERAVCPSGPRVPSNTPGQHYRHVRSSLNPPAFTRDQGQRPEPAHQHDTNVHIHTLPGSPKRTRSRLEQVQEKTGLEKHECMILLGWSSSCRGLAAVVLHVPLKRGARVWPQLYSAQYLRSGDSCYIIKG